MTAPGGVRRWTLHSYYATEHAPAEVSLCDCEQNGTTICDHIDVVPAADYDAIAAKLAEAERQHRVDVLLEVDSKISARVKVLLYDRERTDKEADNLRIGELISLRFELVAMIEAAKAYKETYAKLPSPEAGVAVAVDRARLFNALAALDAREEEK